MSGIFIIAEAGVNHNGSIDKAIELIDFAAESGADAVKFQTFRSEKVISRGAPKAEYQKQTTDAKESQLEMARRLELPQEDFRKLAEHCRRRGIIFLSTPFDFESIDFLVELGLQTFKIPSGEITNLPYLRKVGSLHAKVILSTGMASLREVERAIDILESSGTDKAKLTVMHCNSAYPTKMEDVNLLAMVTMRNLLGVEVGYSDHTLGIEVPVAAAALGAKVIEKHFTADKNMEGPDHAMSLEPKELKMMVSCIRNIEKAFGDGVKKASLSESLNIEIARRSIVAAKCIKCGEIFTAENLTTKRPGTGLNPMMWDEVIGTTADRDYDEDDFIEPRYF